MMSHNFLACMVALTVILASGADAQTSAVELRIRLDDALCEGVQDVSVVTNGRDSAFRAVKVSNCNWKITDIPRHNLDISYFSLRLGGVGRTGCRRARLLDGANIQLVFTKAGKAEAHRIEIDGAPLDYARELAATGEGDIQCSEKGVVPATLFDVQFDIEDLRLRLFEKKTVACGVILNDVAAVGNAKKGDVVEITSRELAPAVVKQGLKGKACFAPTFTPPEALERSLGRNPRLNITVK